MNAKSILESITDDSIEDLALTFVEHDLGRFDFAGNWDRQTAKHERVASWLTAQGEDETLANEIVSFLDGLRKRNMKWIANREFDSDSMKKILTKEQRERQKHGLPKQSKVPRNA